ncbi:MAG: methyltransferase domain-containing protein [Planctomycetota bacterium]
MNDVLSLPFDQYQRYRLVADLLNEVRENGQRLQVLDVGGRTARLRQFLPGDRVVLVDTEPSDAAGLLLASGTRLPFRDRSFDAVCAFDTLEHVPPPLRAAFVAECVRVSRGHVFLAGPYQHARVEEAELALQAFLRDKLGVEHHYLDEHRRFGLPARADVEGLLAAHGARVASIAHGNVERWLALMCLALYLDQRAELRPTAARLYRFYNEFLYASDCAEPVYRHVVVAALAGARLPAPRAFVQASARDAWGPVSVLARELVGRERVFERLECEIAEQRRVIDTFAADLAGHRATQDNLLRERERLIEDFTRDLAGHKATIAILEADLSGHRKALADLRARVPAS